MVMGRGGRGAGGRGVCVSMTVMYEYLCVCMYQVKVM